MPGTLYDLMEHGSDAKQLYLRVHYSRFYKQKVRRHIIRADVSSNIQLSEYCGDGWSDADDFGTDVELQPICRVHLSSVQVAVSSDKKKTAASKSSPSGQRVSKTWY